MYNICKLMKNAPSYPAARISTGQKMYHIIVNSKRVNGKNASAVDIVKNVFDRAGKQYEFHYTEYSGHARKIAEELTAGGERTMLIAMGGDGTLHEVLNGIKDPSLCKLGVIPVGSGNDFAAAIGIPERDVKYAAQVIAFRSPVFIDYIETSMGLRSINAVGCGMDVDVLKRAYAARRNGKSKYIYGFFKSLFRYKARNFSVEVDDGERKYYKGLLACLGNGKQIGGGIRLFPEARVDDGLMDFMIVDYLSVFKTFIAFAKLFLGKLKDIKEVTFVRCKKAVIYPETDKEKFTIQAEGELYDIENECVTAEVVSGKLRFYLPHSE